MLGFGSIDTALSTIRGLEIMHMIRKGQVDKIRCVLTEVQFINRLMGIPA
jgi:transposase-like protein